MPKERSLVYWDADVSLSYIEGLAERLPTLDALLADSASPNGSIEIMTSYITKVEVAFMIQERTKRALDSSIEQKMDKLRDSKAVKLIEVHENIVLEARNRIRAAMIMGWSLKPLDAIHLATAKWHKVSDFHTYDKELYKYSNDVGFPIRAPFTQRLRLPLDT